MLRHLLCSPDASILGWRFLQYLTRFSLPLEQSGSTSLQPLGTHLGTSQRAAYTRYKWVLSPITPCSRMDSLSCSARGFASISTDISFQRTEMTDTFPNSLLSGLSHIPRQRFHFQPVPKHCLRIPSHHLFLMSTLAPCRHMAELD